MYFVSRDDIEHPAEFRPVVTVGQIIHFSELPALWNEIGLDYISGVVVPTWDRAADIREELLRD